MVRQSSGGGADGNGRCPSIVFRAGTRALWRAGHRGPSRDAAVRGQRGAGMARTVLIEALATTAGDTMTRFDRRILVGTAAAGLFLAMALAPAAAEAHGGWWRFHRRGAGALVGAAVVGAVIGAAVAAPSYEYGYPYAQPAPYRYAPPVVVAPAPGPQWMQLGLDVAGVAQASSRQATLSGMAASVQVRTSSHSLLALEVQSLTSDHTLDNRRDELDGLLAGRVYLWNAPLAPYLGLAGGVGRAAFEGNGYRVTSAELLGRIGLGLELRLGDHLVLEGEVGQVHRLHLEDAPPRFGDPCCGALMDQHESATEVRGGLAFRF
jgi:hypothetical protein